MHVQNGVCAYYIGTIFAVHKYLQHIPMESIRENVKTRVIDNQKSKCDQNSILSNRNDRNIICIRDTS